MKFRRLYWVTEQLGENGTSQIGGVYTSIHDLLERGLCRDEAPITKNRFRVSLVKLDSNQPPLGQWTSPGFQGMKDALQEFVDTDEFNAQDCEQLVEDLCKFSHAS